MADPVMRRVFSSHVEAIGYDEATGELHVTFQAAKDKPPQTAVYQGVSAKKARDVLSAPSIGMALHNSIRGHHDFSYKGGQ
jgi:phage baseplate assembly protein gpV